MYTLVVPSNMEVNCEGCAGCCLDWRSTLEEAPSETGRERGRQSAPIGRRSGDDERRGTPSAEGKRDSLDGDTNFVALTRDEVRKFLEAGMAAALTPRFWRARDEREGIDIDGYSVASVAGRPVFFVGLRKPPKPVAPFGREDPQWIPACVFLDPATLQCRIHESDHYPDECRTYPAHTLALEHRTECERVETATDEERLLERTVPDDLDTPLFGPQALGAKLFAHPRPEDLAGVIGRCADGEVTAADRAECLAVAAASSPGTVATSPTHYEEAKSRPCRDSSGEVSAVKIGDEDNRNGDTHESWIGPALREWNERRRNAGERAPSLAIATEVEDARGAPETPGWDALE